MSNRQPFRKTLTELEAAREELNRMFEPAHGWEWLREPTREGASGVGMTDGVVLHRMELAGHSGRDGEVGPSRLAVVAAQAGSDARPRREFRPVAYDREGTRRILRPVRSASSGPEPNVEGWTASSLYTLNPDDLAADDVAFVGVEVREQVVDDGY